MNWKQLRIVLPDIVAQQLGLLLHRAPQWRDVLAKMTYVPGKNDNINISHIIQKLPTREAFLAATCMQVYEVNDYSSCLKKLK